MKFNRVKNFKAIHTEDAGLHLMERARKQIRESCEVKQSIPPEFLSKLCEISERTAKALRDGGCVFFCGNGGSAADAQHLAAEFVGRFRLERSALPSMALTTNSSLLTAVANDYGYDQVFGRQIQAFGKPGDILFALSTSGMSANVLIAAREAKQRGLYTIGLTGRNGGKLREYADALLDVPSDDTPRIQETHILVGHIFCDLVETLLAGDN